MKTVRLHVTIEFGRKTFAGLCAAALLLHPAELNPESFKMTTVYPAPAGVYQRLVTTGDTLLGRDGGKVEIGADLRLAPLAAAPKNPVDGTLYFDKNENGIMLYFDNRFNKLSTGLEGEILGEHILGGEAELSGNWKQVGGLRITEETPQRGLYAITWGGKVRIDANQGKTAHIRVIHGSDTLVHTNTVADGTNLGNVRDGVHDFVRIDGSTMLYLQKGRNYDIRIEGKRKGSAAVNDSWAVKNMYIRVELIMPF